ncbi:MAG TPA: carbon-nitrogen hydrolase family protein [Anaerolineae bacterium]
MRDATIAIVQFHPRLGDVTDNLDRMGKVIDQICHAQKVNLIVFPELVTTGYENGVKFTELAEQIPGYSQNYLGKLAGDFHTYIAFGMVVKHKVESVIYNSAVLLGPDGEVKGEYRKVHLKGEEKLAFRPGYKFPVVETEFGMLGLLLGWDLAFPEAARSLALEGAELIVVCANWEAPHVEEWRAYMLARAYENAVFVAGANRIGDEYTYSFFGESMIIGPRGELYAQVMRDENDKPKEAYALAKLDLDLIKKHREELQVMQSRQPSAYRAVVKQY